jgi:hypothetical protein
LGYLEAQGYETKAEALGFLLEALREREADSQREGRKGKGNGKGKSKGNGNNQYRDPSLRSRMTAKN